MGFVYPNEMTINGKWEKSTLLIFKNSITRYLEVLKLLRADGNKDIEKDLVDWSAILQSINEEISKLDIDYESGDLPMYGKNYGKLFDILWKQCSYKKQLLDERKRKILAEAAHQGATEELEQIRSVLSLPFWEQVNRQNALVDSFYPSELENPPKEKNSGLQVTIGNLYGQFAAYNYGAMTQHNNSEVVNALKDVTDELVNSKIPDDKKQDALADIQVMQTQLQRSQPNRKILEICLQGLQVAANLAQISQVVAPHIGKIQTFIASLPTN